MATYLGHPQQMTSRPAPVKGTALHRGSTGEAIFAGAELFGELPATTRRRLAALVERRYLAAGEVLVRQGEAADSVFVVVSGKLRASVSQDGQEVALDDLGPGRLVGEFALLSDRPRSATVQAVRDSEVLRLSSTAFHQVLRAHPEVGLALSRRLIERVAGRPGPKSPSGVQTVAVLGAGPRPIALGPFCRSLARALAALGPTAHVDGPTVDRALGIGMAERGPGARHSGELTSWLHRLEEDHRFVLYQADGAPTEWTRRCVRQADVVLLVADPRGGPAVGPVESEALSRDTTRTELVLVHPDASPPTGTAAWLEARAVQAHHHFRAGSDADHSRLARRLGGQAVAVVLGGGGARGFAHLGVLRAIEEFGIPIDAVGGTSIGAIMAASVAMDWDAGTRLEKMTAAFVGTRFLVGLTPPAVALSSSRKLTGLLRHPDHFGERAIEDLRIPFFCVSANLSRAEAVTHERGALWWGLRASIALPGILPPVWADGDLLVDGGVLDDLPVGTMRARLGGQVIAVDLHADVDLRVAEAFSPTVSGWRLWGRRLHPWRASHGLPSAIEVLLRAKEVAFRRAQRESLVQDAADVLLRPPIAQCGSLDFRAGTALVEPAYRFASEALARSPLAISHSERTP